MGRGRKPSPDALKVAHGTDQPCRMSGDDGVPKLTDVDQIMSVSKSKLLPTKRSREIFKKKANQLIGMRVLTELDLEHLAVYANSLDVLFSCLEGMRRPVQERYDKHGNLVGYIQPPELSIYKQMVDHVNRIGGEFGFTPVSRQRINQGPAEESDPLADLFSGIR